MNRKLTWGKRLVFVAALLAALFYGILKLAENSGEQIRKGLEDYLKQASAQDAEITDLPVMKLIPDVVIQANGIVVRDRLDKEKTLARAREFRVAMPLWQIFFGGNSYHVLTLEDFEAASGYLLPRKLNGVSAGIVDSGPDETPSLLAEGQYGGADFRISADMTRRVTGKGPLYAFGARIPLRYKIGTLEGQLTYVRDFTEARIEGMAGDTPYEGRIEKKDGLTTLRLTPLEKTPGGAKDVARFAGDLRKVLGVTDETALRIVEE